MDPLKVLIVGDISDAYEMLRDGIIDLVIEEHLFRELGTQVPEAYVFEVYATEAHRAVIKSLWESGICYKQSSGNKRLRNTISVPWARTYAGYATEHIVHYLRSFIQLDISRIGPPRIEEVKLGYLEKPKD